MSNGAKEFQESITSELNIIKNRVRNLIGSANWNDEGRYKEAIFKNVIRRFLPSYLSVGSGFIVKSSMPGETIISKQLDVIIYDNRIPILFSEGDFVITTPGNVRGIIEVKTNTTIYNFSTYLTNLEISLLRFPEFTALGKKIFAGLFSFSFDDDINSEYIEKGLKESRKKVNHISLGSNYFIRYWNKHRERGSIPPNDCTKNFYNVYDIYDLSFSYFISNLLHSCTESNLSDRYWYSFPIEGTKEVHKIKTVCIP